MRKEEIGEITSFLESNGTQFIRYIWCGNSNIIRGKAVHINRLEAYLQDGIGISAAHQTYPAIADYMIAGCGIPISEEIRMVADWDTLTVLPYAAGHARVLTDLFKEGQPWSCCPRHFLKRMIKEAASEGLKIVAAFENEFFLLKSSESQLIPANNTVLSGSSWTMDLQHGLINDISDALINQDVPVELYHPESGPGHHEISVSHTHALSAADQQIVFRETVKAVAHQHHLIASFLPKIFSAMEEIGRAHV